MMVAAVRIIETVGLGTMIYFAPRTLRSFFHSLFHEDIVPYEGEEE